MPFFRPLSNALILTGALFMAVSLANGFIVKKQETPSASRLNLGAPEEASDAEGDEEFIQDVGARGISFGSSAKQSNELGFSPMRFWPKSGGGGVPVIEYHFDGYESYPIYSEVRAAIAHIEENTCIVFREVSPLVPGNKLVFSEGACFTAVGREAWNLLGTRVRIEAKCSDRNDILHLLAHSIGLFHEHNRSDRDAYVEVFTENVQRFYQFLFGRLLITNNYDTQYDYLSITQYGPLAYSRNGKTTISATDPMAQGLLATERDGFSYMDKLIINRMYGCDEFWRERCKMENNPCWNSGYMGSDCNCVCRPGTSGSNCESASHTYLEALMRDHLPNNEVVTVAGDVTSPQYPTPQTDGTAFTKMIVAPHCNRIELTVVGFEMEGRCKNDVCCEEGLEVRTDDLVTGGSWYCGTELSVGDTITSSGNTMALFYLKDEMARGNANEGFSFTVAFVAITGCV